jgi:hypothetical protein
VIELNGNEAFRRTACELASQMGIETVGYDPSSGNGSGADGNPGNPQQKGPDYEPEPEPTPEQKRSATGNPKDGGDPANEYGDQYADENGYER